MLAFLGKRMRDENLSVVELIFDQFIENGVTICQFPTPEARMLVLTEGFMSQRESVRQKCIHFLKPTVLEYAEHNDIAGLLKLIEAKLAFGNQYFGGIPGLLTLVILETLDNDMLLADYLEKVVLKKARAMAGISLKKKKTKKVGDQKKREDYDEIDLAFMEKEGHAVQDAEMDSDKASDDEEQKAD